MEIRGVEALGAYVRSLAEAGGKNRPRVFLFLKGEMVEFKIEGLGQMVIDLKTDGTYWIDPEITDEEIRKALPHLLSMAAQWNQFQHEETKVRKKA